MVHSLRGEEVFIILFLLFYLTPNLKDEMPLGHQFQNRFQKKINKNV
jgi:hypothetical protein